jgi:hypothetical protein
MTTTMATRKTRATSGRGFGEGLYEDETAAEAAAGRPTSGPSGTYRVETGQPDLDAEYFDQCGSHLEEQDRLAGGARNAAGARNVRPEASKSVTNPETGKHRTFRIETLRGDWNPGKRVVSILDGPDNTSDYKRFGWVDEFGFKLWGRFQIPGVEGKPSIWESYIRMLENPKRFTERGLSYVISGKCRRCGRALTVERSVTLGIGPRCEEKE